MEREILKAVLWSLISFKRLSSSRVNQSGCHQVVSSASSLALFTMNFSSCSKSSGVGWGDVGREDSVFSCTSCLMKSLMLDLKLSTYTSLSFLLFIFFASFLVKVLLLRGMNLKLGSLSLREIAAWSLGTPFVFHLRSICIWHVLLGQGNGLVGILLSLLGESMCHRIWIGRRLIQL